MNVYPVILAGSCNAVIVRVFEEECAALTYAKDLASYYDPVWTQDDGEGWLATFSWEVEPTCGVHRRDVKQCGLIGKTVHYVGVQRFPLVRDWRKYRPDQIGDEFLWHSVETPITGPESVLPREAFERLTRGDEGLGTRVYKTARAAYRDLKLALGDSE